MTDSATSWIENEDRGCRHDRITRLEWLLENYPANHHGLLLAGGELTLQLLDEARYCFTYGNYLATAVLGAALIERILAANFSLRGRDDLERTGAQSLFREARRCGWITEAEHRQLDRVRQLRNPLVHYRRPYASGTAERRAVQQECELDNVLEEDARTVLSAVFGILAKAAI